MNKEFKDISIGEEFFWNNTKYQKIKEERISCCKSINAVATDNIHDRRFVSPSTIVETGTNQ
jgi:hypothetical protein